jgi:RNA polymerase sigma-70 factor (ECF subfamily)
LFGAVRNQALRRFTPAANAAEPVEPSTSERECLTAELQRIVPRAILRLPAGQREVLVLAHFEQMPLVAIAEVLEIEIAAVKSRLQRARGTLREVLAAYAPNQERRS